MPQPNLGPPETQIGGYIPYLDIPCERYVGESIGWAIFLSTSGPALCYYIPWLCCPIPFELNNTQAVSADIDCGETGAVYGATLFWTMQAFSVWGLVLALTHVARCSAEIGLGIQEAPSAVKQVFGLVKPPDKRESQTGGGFLPSEQELFDLNKFQKLLRGELEEKKEALLPTGNVTHVPEGPAKGHEKEEGKEGGSAGLAAAAAVSPGGGNETRGARVRRQAGFLGISIPTLSPIYRGADERSDNCEREEIMHVDGECHQLLSQGPCEDTEFVLMNPQTKKGYCAPRLCNPDRVFVFGDQLCHDPYENAICPPGRQLFTTSFGSPVCGCPYGTYEEEDDLDEDVCEPVLGKLEGCAAGEVFWFTSFRREPQCLPDPCKGINARRGPNQLPYVPSIWNGKCYQLGQELHQCPEDTFYTLSYTSLKGLCAELEEAGYTVLDEGMLQSFASLYGSRLSRGRGSSSLSSSPSSFFNSFSSSSRPSSSSSSSSLSSSSFDFSDSDDSSSSNNLIRIPEIGSSAVPFFAGKSNVAPLQIGQSITSFRSEDSDDGTDNEREESSRSKAGSKYATVQLIPTHASAFSPSALSFPANSPLVKLFKQFLAQRSTAPGRASGEREGERENRTKRGRRSSSPLLQHASPDTVFQPSLASCRAGGQLGLNFKCNTKYLPNRLPLSRPKRNVAPNAPYPSCPKGSLYTIHRTCVSNQRKVKTSLIAHGLG